MNDKDTIYRQKAIDAILQFMPAKLRDDATVEEQINYEVWRCALGCAVSSVGTQPPAQTEPRWIPVTERLPEEEVDVVVTRHFYSDKELRKNGITEKYYVEVASRIDDEWFSYSDEYKIRRHLHEVTAWMPLPKPWKGGDES